MNTEVTEQNRVIAEFMGLKVIPAGTKALCDFLQGEVSAAFLKYHEDWNQIHAVWDRFKNLKISEVDEGFNDKYSRHLQAISTALHAFPITTVHIRLYNAIQWYQSVKK